MMVSTHIPCAYSRISLRRALSLLLAGLISVGSPVMAAVPVEIRASDVTLEQSGVLQGTVLNTAAQPVAGISVRVLHGETAVATATSDENGHFMVTGLRNGSHVIQIGESVHPVRFWGNDVAPPASVSRMSIVVDEQVVRGQAMMADSRIGQMVKDNPLPILLISGAVALILLTDLDEDDDDVTVPVSP